MPARPGLPGRRVQAVRGRRRVRPRRLVRGRRVPAPEEVHEGRGLRRRRGLHRTASASRPAPAATSTRGCHAADGLLRVRRLDRSRRASATASTATQPCIDEEQGASRSSLFGHTDTSGTEEYNIALSERRAQSVADYLARLGTDPARCRSCRRARPSRPASATTRIAAWSSNGTKKLALRRFCSPHFDGCFWATTKSEGEALRARRHVAARPHRHEGERRSTRRSRSSRRCSTTRRRS